MTDVKQSQHIALIGFGEAGQAFAKGWLSSGVSAKISAFDIKTQNDTKSIAIAKFEDYQKHGVIGCDRTQDALKKSEAVFSLVTADQAENVASDVASSIAECVYYFDCNSCSPGSKRQSAAIIEEAGGRYVDMAVMAPVHPKLHQTPALVSGPHALEASTFLNTQLNMSAKQVGGDIGAASSIKMVRSVLMKGLEAVILECVLTGRRAGVDDIVLESLEQTYPGFGWKKRAAYMMERAATHGIRRAAEMREVANTVREFGFDGEISDAAANWEKTIGDLNVDMSEVKIDDHGAVADALLAALDNQINKAEMKKETR
ncbi:MAG: DUF1932 domain-containing protein [Salaquimonas sp.]